MKRTLQKLTSQGLVNFLTNETGSQCRFITVEANTEVTKIKKNNPFGKVFKRAVVNGWINFDYSRAVEKNVAKKLGIDPSEVEYTAGETWHVPVMVNGKASCVHVNKNDTGKAYLFYRLNKTFEAVYTMEDGTIISYDAIKPYLYASKPSEFKPKVNCLTVSNITYLSAMGKMLAVT